MISDKERREVAARMREIMRDDPHGWLDMMVAKAVVDVMGEGVTVGETLADLIDRPTCRDVCGRSRGDAAQAVGEVVGSLRYHAQRMASIPPKVAVQLAERLERAVGEL